MNICKDFYTVFLHYDVTFHLVHFLYLAVRYVDYLISSWVKYIPSVGSNRWHFVCNLQFLATLYLLSVHTCT